MRRAWLFLMIASACHRGIKDGYFVKGDIRYRVAIPSEKNWRQVGFSENDLAWVGPQGHILALNCTCTEHGDPPLEALTHHLLAGFTDREKLHEERREIDGREGLVTRHKAKLDGVPVDLRLAVLKKDGCVYDFTSLGAPEATVGAEEFEKLLAGFTTEGAK